MSGGRALEHDWFSRPLPENVAIGARSWVYSSFAFLHYRSRRPCGVRIGEDTGVYRGTMFDLGPHGEVDIGDFCAVVGAIFVTNRRVVVGDYALVAHEVVIADSFAPTPPRESDRDDRPIATDNPEIGIFIGENAWIGARAVLLGGARIGAGAIVGAAAVVDFAVPPLAIVAGNPARIVGEVAARRGRTHPGATGAGRPPGPVAG